MACWRTSFGESPSAHLIAIWPAQTRVPGLGGEPGHPPFERVVEDTHPVVAENVLGKERQGVLVLPDECRELVVRVDGAGAGGGLGALVAVEDASEDLAWSVVRRLGAEGSVLGGCRAVPEVEVVLECVLGRGRRRGSAGSRRR